MYCRHTPAFFIVITMNQIRWTSNRPWKRHFTGICGAILEPCFEENTQIGAAFYIGSLGCCTMSPCMSLHTRRMRRSISQTERLFHRGSHLLSGCWLTEDLFIANFLFKLLGGFRVQGLGFRDVLSSNFFLEISTPSHSRGLPNAHLAGRSPSMLLASDDEAAGSSGRPEHSIPAKHLALKGTPSDS